MITVVGVHQTCLKSGPLVQWYRPKFRFTCCIFAMSRDSSYSRFSAPGLRKSQKISGDPSLNTSSFVHET